MDLQTKKMLLVGAAIACLVLAYYGSENIPLTGWLPFIAGGAHTLNFVVNTLAK